LHFHDDYWCLALFPVPFGLLYVFFDKCLFWLFVQFLNWVINYLFCYCVHFGH
jgi:hypothetical protein